jgi:prolyl oligopeptidase
MKIITKKVNQVDNYHGVQVADPYRWLEASDTPDTIEWTDAQNQVTRQYLDDYPAREKIKQNITKLMDYTKYTVPQKEGDYYYYHKNDGLQNQSVFYRSSTLERSDETIVIDPNKLSKEGTAALTNITFSQDGSLMVYAISYNGSDWQDFKIKDPDTGEDYPETLKWCKFSNIAWGKNQNGFYYSRYPNPNTIMPGDESSYNRVYWHTVGTPQESDLLIYEDLDHKEFSFFPELSDDNNYLVLKVYNGTEPISSIYYCDLNGHANAFIPLIDDRKAEYSFLGNTENIFYIYTNRDAPKGKIIGVNLNKPEIENWREIIPESADTLSYPKIMNHKFVIVSMHNAYDQLKIYDMDGNFEKELALPKFITVTGLSGKKNLAEMFVSYTSYLQPVQVIRYQFEQDRLDTVMTTEIDLQSDQFETRQIFYTSKDGTEIPMFITHKKGLSLTGENPVLLYGYGGYNISMSPNFSASQMMWLQAGGVYAVANLRGGGEFGEEWHLQGILEKKQNVFDDFIAAAEWLISEKYTNPKRLAIMGGSNGGLLVGTCINQRPDLFGAALCLVPVTDILRFHRFTVGRFWTTEFGNAEENPDHFSFMYKYSPLHNVKDGTHYPPTLVTTADSDDRVVPLHAKKFAATLQAAQTGDHPILLRVEKNAGHGLGKPTSKIIEEQTDLYAFLFKELGIS